MLRLKTNYHEKALERDMNMDLKSMLGPVYPLDRWQEAMEAHKTMQYAKVLIKC